jgi:4-nitrophenyl phosphatase
MGHTETTRANQLLAGLKGFAFDLDGTIWEGPRLLPGAIELVDSLRSAGLGVVFASNCSRHGSDILATKLAELGIPTKANEIVTPFDLVGEAIDRKMGKTRVLVLGTDNLAGVLKASGHEPIPLESWTGAEAVVVGIDHDFSYDRLRAAARAVAAGATLFAVNMDASFPVGPGLIDPGCGALARAIGYAGRKDPVAIGKPEPPLFQSAAERMGCQPNEVAMVGDSLASDIAGGRAVGMVTIWINPAGPEDSNDSADITVRDLPELMMLWKHSQAEG